MCVCSCVWLCIPVCRPLYQCYTDRWYYLPVLGRAAEELRESVAERKQHLRRARQQGEELATCLERLQQRSDVQRDLDERTRLVSGRRCCGVDLLLVAALTGG